MAITDGFKTTLNPDNRSRYPELETVYTIDVSGTAMHAFVLNIPHSVISNIEVAYRQGVETLLNSALIGADISHSWTDLGDDKTEVVVYLTEEQTRVFDRYESTALDTFAQLSIFTVAGGIIFSELYPVWVSQPIVYASEGESIVLQRKTVAPTTEEQEITPDEGYDGLESVTVEAVTYDIDENIISGNIRRDVNILGVTGSLEAGGIVRFIECVGEDLQVVNISYEEVETMPEPTQEFYDISAIFKYVGETTVEFIQNYFYSVTQVEEEYLWENIGTEVPEFNIIYIEKAMPDWMAGNLGRIRVDTPDGSIELPYEGTQEVEGGYAMVFTNEPAGVGCYLALNGIINALFFNITITPSPGIFSCMVVGMDGGIITPNKVTIFEESERERFNVWLNRHLATYDKEPPTRIGSFAYAGLESDTSTDVIEISANCKISGKGHFRECKVQVNIHPDNPEELKEEMFKNYAGEFVLSTAMMETLWIPESCFEITQRYGDIHHRKLNLGNNIGSISKKAFAGFGEYESINSDIMGEIILQGPFGHVDSTAFDFCSAERFILMLSEGIYMPLDLGNTYVKYIQTNAYRITSPQTARTIIAPLSLVDLKKSYSLEYLDCLDFEAEYINHGLQTVVMRAPYKNESLESLFGSGIQSIYVPDNLVSEYKDFYPSWADKFFPITELPE